MGAVGERLVCLSRLPRVPSPDILCAQDFKSDLKFQSQAVLALQEAAEAYMVREGSTACSSVGDM